ncbi:Rha family transcriptional regulator [Rufibacter latericius]|uniref:Uncharacterized protein n=1 Tax=Rufibacter latericius TaxID=2487040 RepID=A0A3M9MDU9_9BACT|nr:hypothetical protein EFB08_17660 [Rufibacter latericius]
MDFTELNFELSEFTALNLGLNGELNGLNFQLADSTNSILSWLNILTPKESQAVTSSRIVADVFGKRHTHILDSIKNLDCGEAFTEPNFRLSEFHCPQF